MFTGGGFGIRVVGGKEIPGTNGEIGAYIANLAPAGTAELSGKVVEGKALYCNFVRIFTHCCGVILQIDDGD